MYWTTWKILRRLSMNNMKHLSLHSTNYIIFNVMFGRGQWWYGEVKIYELRTWRSWSHRWPISSSMSSVLTIPLLQGLVHTILLLLPLMIEHGYKCFTCLICILVLLASQVMDCVSSCTTVSMSYAANGSQQTW